MSKPLVYESSLASVIDLVAREQEPGWLAALREKGAAIHRESGVPTMRQEEWKYTALRPVASVDWQPGEPGPAVFESELGRY
ncbi:MAG: hypothetical protein JNL44_17335, partial [Gemmatimonadetes bacterium]|nr:hypothetical protein [Gemmatimonadota bacterium]